jgi:anhydro-N-acetylmuramic acid kinase
MNKNQHDYIMNWLESILTKNERMVIGLMSGTSMDGIDTALVRISGNGFDTKIKLVDFATYPYESRVRFALQDINNLSVIKLSDLNFVVGEAFADATISIIEKAGLKPEEIDLIGSHGQTVYHNPPSMESEFSSTLQIGEADVIAEKTGITTIADFRTRDVALGGEGAPLVPYVDYLLFRETDKVKIALNIGGISNSTLITTNLDDVFAYDSGPGNMLIDDVIRIHTHGKENFDKDGKIACSGEYYKERPPKTTGREMFGREEAERLYKLVENKSIKLNVLISTLVQFTVDTIYNSYEDFIFSNWKIDEVILSGGGAFNPVIVERLMEKLKPIPLSLSEKYQIPPDSKEAIAFAILANETIFTNYSNLPNVTGARSGAPLGKISIGKNKLVK